MSVTRVEKNRDFTTVNNSYLRDGRLSLKAKGLFTIMLSLPDDWAFSISGFATFSKDGRDSVMNVLVELEQFGYLKRKRATDGKGHFAGYNYDVYEQPQNNTPYTENPNTENPNTGKPYTEKPYTENPTLLNTNIPNTKKQNISSKSDDERDIQLSLSADNDVIGEKPAEGDTRVITMSVKEAAEEIYKPYPRKEGKAKGFEEIQAYLKKGRSLAGLGTVKFNHEQLYCAVRDYAMDCSEKNTERQYIQLFSTFMNKTVSDYVEKSVSGYEKYMERKYGDEWRSIKFNYR